MRKAIIIQDVKHLLGDYSVSLILNGSTVECHFPQTNEYAPTPNRHISGVEEIKEHHHFSRIVRCTIRNLVESPQFWRCTTVADQLTRFWRDGHGKRYGIVKLRKKGGQPFKIIFDTDNQAQNFCKFMLK